MLVCSEVQWTFFIFLLSGIDVQYSFWLLRLLVTESVDSGTDVPIVRENSVLANTLLCG